MADEQSSTPLQSQVFCDPSADVVFRSSDGVLFRMHKKYLDVASGGFPVLESLTIDDEPVPLQEPSPVLELLFQFIRPPTEATDQRQPNLIKVGDSLFFQVAEAAEKYQVYGAMNTAITYIMAKKYRTHPLETLNHTARHGYTELADMIAKVAISKPDDMFVQKLTHPGILSRLVYFASASTDTPADQTFQILYRSQYMSLGNIFLDNWAGYCGNGNCSRLQDLRANYLERLRINPLAATSLVPVNYSRPCPLTSGGYSTCGCMSLSGVVAPLLSEKSSTFKSFSEINITH